ncbi:MAG: hypothetical protein HYS18_15610 [Burkholderiales bacterium]|nr:hypothetical protein [Burkholderiales bacterium]
MSKYLLAVVFATLALSIASVDAQAATAEQKAPVKKSTSKIKTKAKSTKGEEAAPSGMISTDFHCTQGKTVTIYNNPSDEQHPMMRWNKKMHKMTAVETESGAVRLENTSEGLTWISVPAKAMLLDAKKGQTIANDCKK